MLIPKDFFLLSNPKSRENMLQVNAILQAAGYVLDNDPVNGFRRGLVAAILSADEDEVKSALKVLDAAHGKFSNKDPKTGKERKTVMGPRQSRELANRDKQNIIGAMKYMGYPGAYSIE